MQELVIRGATVHDGTGRPGRQTDVAISGGRIAAVGADAGRDGAARMIDGGGLVLAPGFIDLHSHADFTLPSYPGALNSLAQGVTTEVIGNCGYTPAPVSPDSTVNPGPNSSSTTSTITKSRRRSAVCIGRTGRCGQARGARPGISCQFSLERSVA